MMRDWRSCRGGGSSFPWEVGGEPEGVDAAAEEGGEVFSYSRLESGAGRCVRRWSRISPGGGDAVAEGADEGEALLVAGLVRLFRGHLAQGDLVDDVLGLDEMGYGGERQAESLEITVAFARWSRAHEAYLPDRETGRRRRRDRWPVGQDPAFRGGLGLILAGAVREHAAITSGREPCHSPAPSCRHPHAKEPVLDPKESVSTAHALAMST